MKSCIIIGFIIVAILVVAISIILFYSFNDSNNVNPSRIELGSKHSEHYKPKLTKQIKYSDASLKRNFNKMRETMFNFNIVPLDAILKRLNSSKSQSFSIAEDQLEQGYIDLIIIYDNTCKASILNLLKVHEELDKSFQNSRMMMLHAKHVTKKWKTYPILMADATPIETSITTSMAENIMAFFHGQVKPTMRDIIQPQINIMTLKEDIMQRLKATEFTSLDEAKNELMRNPSAWLIVFKDKCPACIVLLGLILMVQEFCEIPIFILDNVHLTVDERQQMPNIPVSFYMQNEEMKKHVGCVDFASAKSLVENSSKEEIFNRKHQGVGFSTLLSIKKFMET